MNGVHCCSRRNGDLGRGNGSRFCWLSVTVLSLLTAAIFLQYFGTYMPSLRSPSSLRTIEAKAQDERPIAILHVGPRKTATTTIQYVLTQSQTRELLQKDSFVYLGKGNGFRNYNKKVAPFIKKCFAINSTCDDYTVWYDWVDELRERRRNKDNIILSEEALPHVMLSNESLRFLQEAFHGWDVRVVVGFRRYNEWILSEYNQENKYGGPSILTFVKWYKKQMHGRRSKAFMPWDQSLTEWWRPFFPVIDVFNMHACDQDIMECFLCEMIPEAAVTCKGAKEGKLPRVPHENRQESDVSIDSTIIAQAALKSNLVEGKEEEEVAAAVHEFIAHSNSTLNDPTPMTLPLECLSAIEKQEILNKSLKIEREMVPEFHLSDLGENALRLGFAKAVKENRFCNVDVQKLLKDSSLQNFFRELSA